MKAAVPGIDIFRARTRSALLTVLALGLLSLSAAASVRQDASAPAAKPVKLDKSELEIWRDPAFQKRFAESYVAETEIEPPVTADERELLQEALELIASDQMGEAAELLRKEAEENPAVSAVCEFTLANIHFQADELDPAATLYAKAVEKHPKFRRAWKNLGLIRIRQNRFADALPALTRVLELGGGDSLIYGLLGYAHASVENYISAESAYRMAVLLDAETMDWKMGLARTQFKQERYAEAAAFCGQLLKSDPGRADLWLLQANAYLAMEDMDQAARNYELVDGLGKSTFASLAMLGDIYVNGDLYAPAVDAYLRAMEKDDQSRVERFIRASKALAARSAHDETERLLKRIEDRYADALADEDRKDILKLRARIAVAQGAGEREAEILRRIVALDPLDGEALILLGRHAQRGGDVETALFYYERAEGVEEFEADAKIRHAQLLVEKGNYAEALPLLRRAQAINPRDHVADYLAQVERVAKGR